MLDLTVDIPPPNTTMFDRGINRMTLKIDGLGIKLKKLDKQIRATGRGFDPSGGLGGIGGGKGGGKGGGGKGGGGGGGRKGRFGFGGGGNSGGAANIARAGGLGGQSAIALGAGLGTGSVIAFTAALVTAIKSAGDFEARLGEIGRVASLQKHEVVAFGAAIEGLSTQIPVGVTQLLELASAGANAGLRADELQAFTTAMGELAAIMPSLSAENTRGIVRIANLTGFPVERIAELNGAIVKLQQNSKATAEQLIKLSTRVAQDAGIFGATSEEVLALAASIADLGLQPERASTAIGRTVGQLKNLDKAASSVTDNIIRTFKDKSITFEAFRELARSNPVEALKQIGEQSSNFRQVLKELQITGKQAVLSEALLKNIDTYNKLLDNADPNKTIIDKQITDRAEELNAQFILLTNNIATLGRTIAGGPLGKLLNEGIKNINFTLSQVNGEGSIDALEFARTELRDFDLERRKLLSNAQEQLKKFGDIRSKDAQAYIKSVDEEVKALKRKAHAQLEVGKAAVSSEGFLKSLARNTLKNADFITNQIAGKLSGRSVSDSKEALIEEGILGPEQGGRIAGTKQSTFDLFTKGFDTLTASNRLGESLKRQADISARLAQELTAGEIALEKMTKNSGKFSIQLAELDLAPVVQDFNEIQRQILKLQDKQLLPTDSIASSIATAKKALQDADFDTKLDLKPGNFEAVLSELNVAIDDPTSGKADPILEDARNIVQTLLVDTQKRAEIERFRSLQQQVLLREELKGIEKDKARARREKAPAISVIQDAGSAVELLNKQALDQQVQQQQLAVLEAIEEAVVEDLRLARENKLITLTRPTGG